MTPHRPRALTARHALVAFATATLMVACDNPASPPDPATRAQDEAATLVPGQTPTLSTQAGCPGNSGGICAMSVTAILTGGDKGILLVRTGTYDEATGTHTSNGSFDKVQWKVYDTRGKLLSTRNDSDADGSTFLAKIGTLKPGYRVEVEANIKNQRGKKGTAVVRASSLPVYVPDIDLSAESIDLVVGGLRQPLGPVVAGSVNTFTVDIANLTTLGNTPSTLGIKTLCVVQLDGKPQVPGFTPGFSYIDGALSYIGPGQTEQCTFKLKVAEGTHTLKVTAIAADMFFDGDENNNSTAATVATGPAAPPKNVDVFVRSIERDLGTNGTAPLGLVNAGVAAQYVAKIGVTPNVGDATATTVSCAVTALNVRTGQNVVTNLAGTVTGQASTTSDALCRFSLNLPSNGDVDENYRITVTAQGANTVDPTPGNNTLSGDQTAIVRTDVAVTQVQLSVDGTAQTSLATIVKGKTANYTITFANTSARSATIDCAVTASPPGGTPVPVALVGTTNPITIPAGQTRTCRFDYTFPQLMAVNFVVSAANVSPIDEDPADNTFPFQTVSTSNNEFPALTLSNVHTLQVWNTDANGNVTQITEQSIGVNRITLTFTDATAIIGDFKLKGTLTSGGTEISNAAWTVNDLTPGIGSFAHCVSGVDAGATAVNNHTMTLSVCAQAVPGEPGVQAISIEYLSAAPTPIMTPNPVALGDEITLNVTLEWTLEGSSFHDEASAELSFALETKSTGFPNQFRKEPTGAVTIIRNGNN